MTITIEEIVELFKDNLEQLFFVLAKHNGKIVKVDRQELEFTIEMNEKEYWNLEVELTHCMNFSCSGSGPLMIDFPRADPIKTVSYHHLGVFKFIVNMKKE